MEWFRFYHEALDDLKVQSLPPVTFRHWVNMLCLANLTTPRGTLPDMATIAYRLRVRPSKARELINEFVDRGLLNRDGETLQPHNWKARQRVSDDVAERVRRHRGNVTSDEVVTLQDDLCNVTSNVTGNASVTVTRNRTDTETEQRQNRAEQKEPPLPPKGDMQRWEEFWSDYPKGRGSPANAKKVWAKLSAGDRESAISSIPAFLAGKDWITGFHSGPEVWLRGRCWENPPPPYIPVADLTNPSGNPHLGSWRPGNGPAPHAAEDWQRLRDGQPPAWGSAEGGIDHL